MTWKNVDPVPFHLQDTPEYCGAATAMMMLAALDGTVIQQETLWPFLHRSTNGWKTSPDDLAATLNLWAPPEFTGYFTVKTDRDEVAGTRSVVNGLFAADGAPVAALVFGSSHWVVVRGVNLDEDESGGPYMTIRGFYIHSSSVMQNPVPHAAKDACGTTPDLGSMNENQYVTYEAWKSDFFTGYETKKGYCFISVSSDRRSRKVRLSHQAGRLRASCGFVSQPLYYGNILSPAQATASAVNGIQRHELDQRGPFSTVLRNVTAGPPQLVQRIDVIDWHYYLVPLLDANGVQVAVARTDAVYGTFMGVSAIPAGASPLRNSAAVQTQLAAGFTLAPQLVWKPSEESTSPYYPFHQAVQGSPPAPVLQAAAPQAPPPQAPPAAVRYYSQLGQEFSSLTTLAKGA